jgi:pimeloyl-ACP methyl ester carboxylesterase
MSLLAHSDEGSGPPIVFAHGMASDRTRWHPIVDELWDDFRCVSVDLPVHGASPLEGCDSLSAAGAMYELVAHLELEAPTVVGHSLGANVALLYGATRRPRGVVAVDPAPLHLPHFAARLAPYVDGLRSNEFEAAFLEWEDQFALAGMPGPERSSVLESLRPRREVVLAYWANLLTAEDAAKAQQRFAAALRAIDVPTLICLAEQPSPKDAGVIATMPTATVEVFEGMGHFLHLADPKRFACRLRAWIEGS